MTSRASRSVAGERNRSLVEFEGEGFHLRTNPLIQREREFYDLRWRHSELSESERGRIAAAVATIPGGCIRILDVGCGDGRVSREISTKTECFLVAFDLSAVALAQAPAPKCCGSASELPFADRSFDLVMATEIIEHLPNDIYPRVLCEMARVADRYIIVTVPNRENLDENTAMCPTCGRRFHVWGHLRSYSPQLLQGLFPGFKSAEIFAFGGSGERYNRFLLWVRQKVAGAYYWEDSTFCYFCHAAEPPVPRWPFLRRVCDACNARFWAPYSRRRGWLLALYARGKGI
jgi:SAM-dependent methyltransferase